MMYKIQYILTLYRQIFVFLQILPSALSPMFLKKCLCTFQNISYTFQEILNSDQITNNDGKLSHGFLIVQGNGS